MTEDQLITLEVSIPCDCGHLQGHLFRTHDKQQGPGLIICSPHPLQTGNMDNQVVQAIAKTMATYMPVLVFNYRAVGASSYPTSEVPMADYWHDVDQKGEYDAVVQEVQQVVEWSSQYFSTCHLLGYSFGSYVALQCITDRVLSYTAITPPLTEHDFSALADIRLPASIIMAEKDGVLDGEIQVPENIHCLQVLKCTDHLFDSREQDVVARVADFFLNIKKRSY